MKKIFLIFLVSCFIFSIVILSYSLHMYLELKAEEVWGQQSQVRRYGINNCVFQEDDWFCWEEYPSRPHRSTSLWEHNLVSEHQHGLPPPNITINGMNFWYGELWQPPWLKSPRERIIKYWE